MGDNVLDNLSNIILKKVNSISKEGYRIITTEEVIKSLPKNIKLDKAGIFSTINYLEENNYISVKFSEDDAYCVSPLPKGRMAIEEAERIRNEKKTLNRYLMYFVFAALCGGFFGGVLSKLFLAITSAWW